MTSWEKAVEDAIKENDYLKGDSCESSFNFLIGWAWSNFRSLEKCPPNAAQAHGIEQAVRKFLNYGESV
jgi:hypothetical protein